MGNFSSPDKFQSRRASLNSIGLKSTIPLDQDTAYNTNNNLDSGFNSNFRNSPKNALQEELNANPKNLKSDVTVNSEDEEIKSKEKEDANLKMHLKDMERKSQ